MSEIDIDKLLIYKELSRQELIDTNKSNEDKNQQYINCPKCGWHGAVIDIKTGLITCQYCMYRSKKNSE